MANMDQEDPGRKAFAFKKIIEDYQNSISSVEDVILRIIFFTNVNLIKLT
jgi:hypothetical protein